MTVKKHFAGVNRSHLSEPTVGTDILISYADVGRCPGWWADMKKRLDRGEYRHVILDSGAFTVLSQGITIDATEYAEFATELGDRVDMIVGLDDIDGDLAQTWRNQAELEAAGLKPLIVFHQDEPIAVLHHYVEKYGRVGLGFAREVRIGKDGKRRAVLKYSKRLNREWLREAFDVIDGRAWVHGFAMTSWSSEFPFDSVDSTTWINEVCAIRRKDRTPHHLKGWLADHVAAWGKPAQMRLVIDSYQAEPAGDLSTDLHAQSRGQARTVIARFGDQAEGRLGVTS